MTEKGKREGVLDAILLGVALGMIGRTHYGPNRNAKLRVYTGRQKTDEGEVMGGRTLTIPIGPKGHALNAAAPYMTLGRRRHTRGGASGY